jgi:hypothetical protein
VDTSLFAIIGGKPPAKNETVCPRSEECGMTLPEMLRRIPETQTEEKETEKT